ncbi:MAG: hypothetical protein ABI336_02255 [Humibacillus sp.]
MSDAAGPGPAPTPSASSPAEQFTVPIPAHREAHTQVLPVADLSGPPPVPATPAVRGEPVSPAASAGSGPSADLPRAAPLTSAAPRPGTTPDPLLAQIGSALLWVTVGWWLIVIVRLLGSLVRTGTSPTMLITNIDRWPEETVVIAVVSVLAAVTLLLGRGARGRDALGVAGGLLAVVTVAVAVWRLLP